jgi:type VI secretion system secreted protein VgrG
VLADTSPGAPDLVGGAGIEFHRSTGMVPDREVIMELGGVARVTASAFAVKSFNPQNPALEVAGAAGSGNLEFYDAPGGGPTDPAQAQRQAALLSGAAGAAAGGVSGKSNSVRIAPGRVVEVSGHPLSSLDAAYFITDAQFTVRQRRRGAAAGVERAYDYWFTGISKSTPFVPQRVTPPAQQAGIQTGVVGGPLGEEIYPDESGQVRVQQHWDRVGSRDDKSGTWMRVAQRGTNDSMQLPRIGWNVLTFNEEGAVDAPSVLSRVNDGEHPPAYALPANKTRVVYKTATSPADGTSNEVYFEDIQGSEEMFINASRDMNVFVQNAKVEAVNHDQLRTVGVDHKLVVVDDRTEEVGNDQTITVGANDKLTSGAAHKETVGANLTINIGGNRKLEAGSDSGLTALGNHNLSIGTARIDTCLGDISASAKLFTLTVGAAQLKLSAKGVAEQCGGVAVQTIGGAKLEFTKGSRTVNVDKLMVETVGGLMMLKTDGTYIDGATKTSAWKTGLKMSTKAAESTLINATEKIQLKCGGSSITLEPETLTIETTKLVLSDADAVKIETGEIEHN